MGSGGEELRLERSDEDFRRVVVVGEVRSS